MHIKKQFYKFGMLMTTMLLVFSSLVMVGAYWASMVTIAHTPITNQNAILIGEWETNYILDWNNAPENYVFQPGDIILYTKDGVEYYYVIREPFTKHLNSPPGPGGNWDVTPYSPLANDVIWKYQYSYRFGDVVYYNSTYYIALSTTESRTNDSGNNPYRPTQLSHWRAVENYSSTRTYTYTEPTNQNAGTNGTIHLVRYNNELYRLIQTAPAGTLPTNTTYFQLLEEPIDYFYTH